MSEAQSVRTVYQTVVDDVITGVREAFLDEGMDEQILQELKQLWETKLAQSKAVDSGNTAAHKTAARHEAPPTQHYPAHPAAMRLSTQQQPLGAAAGHTMTPPAAHQGIQIHQQQPLNLQTIQGGHSIQFTNLASNQMSNAAQTAVLSLPANYQQQMNAQGRIALQNGQVVQLMHAQQPISFTTPMTISAQGDVKPLNITLSGQHVSQLDGLGDTSSEEEEEEEDDDDDDEEGNDDNEDAQGNEEEPLNSGDDVSDTDPTEVFDAENVIVCQFDKINRSKNKWKFHLKDGIMNLNGKDYVFQKANGDAEW